MAKKLEGKKQQPAQAKAAAAASVPSRAAAPAAPAARPLGAFGAMRRFAAEMDRVFDDVHTSLFPRGDFPKVEGPWAPALEVSERGGQLVVRAELPGLASKDVQVEVGPDALTVRGQRRQERQEKKKGYFRSERSYGSFYRQIPLPEGVDPESAKATFKDGVLEVTMPAPPKAPKGRSVPVEQG